MLQIIPSMAAYPVLVYFAERLVSELSLHGRTNLDMMMTIKNEFCSYTNM